MNITAEEFLKNKPFSIESIHECMIEFAKLHCIEQAKAICKDVDFTIETYASRQQGSIVEVDKDSILNAYPLDLIK